MVKARVYVFEHQFTGVPKPSDLKITEEELPDLKDGEFLAEALYLSVDPYQRAYAPGLPLGSTFIGTQVAKIIESKHRSYPVGRLVIGEFGWRTHTISKGEKPGFGFPAPWLMPHPDGLPISLSLGVLGMPGITAYFGYTQICQPKSGETAIVTGAAGAVGSIVGQIAKIKGCTVIGVTGSDEKGQWLVNELKFDHFLNYKDKDFAGKLKQIAPQGIDTFFDNVGGEISSIIMNHMNLRGRISVCGAISGYNNVEDSRASSVQFPLVFKQLKMEGINFQRWSARWFEGIKQLKSWIEQGKLQYKETTTEGFDNMFTAFVDMLSGKNFGKAVVKV